MEIELNGPSCSRVVILFHSVCILLSLKLPLFGRMPSAAHPSISSGSFGTHFDQRESLSSPVIINV